VPFPTLPFSTCRLSGSRRREQRPSRLPVALSIFAAVRAITAGDPARADILTVQGFDSAGIRAAVERARPGDAVRLRAGTYNLTAPVTLKSGIRLAGDGQAKTVLRFDGRERGVMISIENAHDVSVSDLTLDGANAGLVSEGIHAYNARRLAIARVAIRDLAKGAEVFVHGIHFVGDSPSREHGVTDSRITDCLLTNIGVGAPFGCGIRMSWGSSRNRVEGCRIRKTGRGGIFGDNGSNDLVIRNNTVGGSGGEMLGIEVWGGCDRCVIEDNRIDHWLSIGGCDWCAARRNVVSAKDGSFGFIGIEVIGSHCVVTDNTVDDGQVIGLSLSNTPAMHYVYYARNTFRACSQWAAQFQGETGGIAYQYLYRCRFVGTTIGRGKVIYPNDAGHGFRVNGNTRHMTFDECEFSGNAGAGFQVTTPDSGSWRFYRCRFAGNKGPAMVAPPLSEPVEWLHCAATNNAGNDLPPARPFPGPAPVAAFSCPSQAAVNTGVRFASKSTPGTGRIAQALWDFGDGPPAGGEQAEHVYRRPGAYRVTLVVWDSAGRASRAERDIKIERLPPSRTRSRPGGYPALSGLPSLPPAGTSPEPGRSSSGGNYRYKRACRTARAGG
jgi:hypothetical protein